MKDRSTTWFVVSIVSGVLVLLANGTMLIAGCTVKGEAQAQEPVAPPPPRIQIVEDSRAGWWVPRRIVITDTKTEREWMIILCDAGMTVIRLDDGRVIGSSGKAGTRGEGADAVIDVNAFMPAVE